MKKQNVMGLSLVVAMALAGTVLAEGGKGGKGEKHGRFKKVDTDGDGKLSLVEFTAMCAKGDADKKFAAADVDKDGFLTPKELKDASGKKCKKGAGCGDKVAPADPAAPVAPAK